MIEHFFAETIPETLLGNLLLTVLILISFYILVRGADLMVEAAVEVARDLGMPKIIIGATIVSLGTTSPEAAVSVLAALQGKPGLAVGNGVGSIVCDLALILGFSMAVAVIPIDRKLLSRQAWIVMGSAVLLALFAYLSPDQTLYRWMGFVFVGLLVAYLYTSYRWARDATFENNQNSGDEDALPARPLLVSLGWLLFGLVLLLGASHTLIPGVTEAAERLHVPKAVIAATMVALGTSLPELMTAITSIRKGHPEITLGNIMGADALNVLFVIGVSAAAVPLKIERVFYYVQAPLMLLMIFTFRVYIWTTRDHFRRWQGVLLLIYYVLFVVLNYAFAPILGGEG